MARIRRVIALAGLSAASAIGTMTLLPREAEARSCPDTECDIGDLCRMKDGWKCQFPSGPHSCEDKKCDIT